MAETVASAVAPHIVDRSVGFAEKHFGYMWNYGKNMAELKRQVEKLDAEREDKSYSVTVAQSNVEKIKTRVERWLDGACKISEEARKILQEYEEREKRRCLMRWCPNPILGYQLSRRACKKEVEILEAIAEAGQIKRVSDRAVGKGSSYSMSTKGLFTFESRKTTLEDIMKTLEDETKNTIGVYGLGGMGKTTLAKQVASRAAEEKMFDEIVMASVTQTVDMKEIQGQIASQLGLELKEITVAERANRIHARLKDARLKGKKVLIILDDLWKKLDLKTVGVPSGNEQMGCKILLTSRFLSVLGTDMRTDKEFALGALKEEEAWRLFEEKTSDVVRNPPFLAIGKEVAKRCAGLPVLIVTVAASLSRRPHLDAWKDALKQLKKMNYKEMHDIVNSAIESISYNHMEKTHKRLFLLCGVIGGDASTEQVLQYSLGWDLFDEEVVTVEQARNSLRTMIINLKESCLLLDVDGPRGKNSIKMHDVVRDVAISIAKKDINAFSTGDNDVDLNTWPKEDILKRSNVVIISGCPNLSCLPQQLECPSLELCIMRGFSRSSLLTIPNTFFEKTNNLKVLDMSQLYFSALPSSLSFLKNLQTLRVDNCRRLEDISIVGELKELQTLSFVGSGIEEVPSEIGQLSKLRLLNLSHCYKLKVIPAGLIAGLSRLEELYMRGGFDRWDVEECLNSGGRSNVSLAELKHLPHLKSLEIVVPNASLLSKDLNFEKWEKYDIIVGDMWDGWRIRDWLVELEITRIVCLQFGTTNINHLQHGIKRLFGITECLCLGELKGVKNVAPELDGNGFPNMKHLRIKQDCDIQYIINMEDKLQKASFPALESLHLSYLLKLQKICNGRLMEESFYNLKIMKVKHCNRLESLFSFSMAIGLRSLQELQVFDCNVLEEIVAEKNREDDGVTSNDGLREKIEFVQLHKLSLRRLPKLNNFSNGKMFSIQKKWQKSECEEIISEEAPFFEKVSFPKLEELKMTEISNLTQIWSHKLPETFCNLTDLEIEKCENLNYLFTPSIVTGLVGLRDLTITNCVKMKSVIAKLEGETEEEAICFPHLSCLCLDSLPSLTTFYSRSVEEMEPNGNLDSTIQPLFNENVLFPKMERLTLTSISNLTDIWSHQVQEMPCCNLTRLTVQNCDNLNYILTSSIARGLAGLQQLTVRSCERMKQVVTKKEGELKMGTIIFPQLSNLCLQKLSNLTTFYWGIEEVDANENLEDATQPLFNEKVKFPSLKKLEIGNLDGIKTIWPSLLRKTQSLKNDPYEILNFETLQRVEVYDCHSLEYVVPVSAARSLKQLEELSIQDCGVETIIGDDEDTKLEEIKAGDVVTTFTFLKLVKFNLSGLPKLKHFYQREHTAHWPALTHVVLSGCDEIQPSMLSLFSTKKVAFPSSMSFRNLLEMEINSFGGLKYLFTRSIAMSLEKLQGLTITKCSMMKAIVVNEGEEEATIDAMIIFPQLSRLHLEDLPNLTRFYSVVEELNSNEKLDSDTQPLFNEKVKFHGLEQLTITRLDSINTIWQNLQLDEVNSFGKGKEVVVTNSTTRTHINLKEESQEIFSFQNVCQMTVSGCKSLKHVFPALVAQSLNKLKYLSIRDCEVLETIVCDENYMESSEEIMKATEQVATTSVFPKLAELYLEKLPKVECFCPKKYTTEWPALRVLDVRDCDKVSALDILTIPEKQEDNGFEKGTSCLEDLSIRSVDLIKILRLYDQFSPHLFPSLQRLTITKFHGEVAVFPSKFLSMVLNHLQTLRVYDCSFQEIFPYEGEVVDHANSGTLLPQLTELELKKLPELKYICKKDQCSTLIPIFNKLEDLSVGECPCLTNLVPASVSFRLLKYLFVLDCAGLTNLMQLSTATSLKQLKWLSISGCELIEEIIEGEVRNGDEESSSFDEIIFNKLEYLDLEKLPRLANFCSSRHYTFHFLELFSVTVTECPNMKTFCGGIATTPKLETVYVGDEECWEGDLNTTVQQIFAKRDERLATALPPTSSTDHFEAETQARDKYLLDPTMEGQNVTNQKEKVVGICEEGKGKELEVSEQGVEDFEKSEDTPRFSNPYCSNCTAQEQNAAAYLASSQHVVASSSQFSPPISNLRDGVTASPHATQVEAQTLAATVSTASSNNQFEAEDQIQDKPPEKSTMERGNEGQICRNGIEKLGNKDEICKNDTELAKESKVRENVTTGPRKGTDIERHEKAIEELIEPTKEGQISNSKHVFDELGVGTSLAASSSQQKGFQGLRVAIDFSQSLSGFLQILQTQPLKSMNAEQVQSMEDAFRDLSNVNFSVDLLSPYVHKARKCLEQKEEICELELKIAEAEELVHALKEKKKVLEEEYEATPL